MTIARSRLGVTVLAFTLACTQARTGPMPAKGDARIDADLTLLRSATASHHSLDSAVAAGYARDVPD